MQRRTALTVLAATPLATALALAGRAEAAETHVVKIQGFSFQPKTISVKVGDTIQFVQMDSAPHTATAKDKSWDTGTLSTAQKVDIPVVAGMGTEYFCRFHPGMKGKIEIAS